MQPQVHFPSQAAVLRLSPQATKLYCVMTTLLDHNHRVVASQQLLATFARMALRTAARALAELRQARLVERIGALRIGISNFPVYALPVHTDAVEHYNGLLDTLTRHIKSQTTMPNPTNSTMPNKTVTSDSAMGSMLPMADTPVFTPENAPFAATQTPLPSMPENALASG